MTGTHEKNHTSSGPSKAFCDLLNIRQAAARAQAEGLPISEYNIRQAVHAGRLPCRIVGRSYYIYWDNLITWLTCAENADNTTGR